MEREAALFKAFPEKDKDEKEVDPEAEKWIRL